MKKIILIVVLAIGQKSFSQNMIDQTRDYIINYNKRMYIGMNNDSTLGMLDEATKFKHIYLFFDGSQLCNGSIEQITTDEMINDVKSFQYHDYKYLPWSEDSRKNNHFLDIETGVEYWFEKPIDSNVWTVYTKKVK